jgi:hypothetical protein
MPNDPRADRKGSWTYSTVVLGFAVLMGLVNLVLMIRTQARQDAMASATLRMDERRTGLEERSTTIDRRIGVAEERAEAAKRDRGRQEETIGRMERRQETFESTVRGILEGYGKRAEAAEAEHRDLRAAINRNDGRIRAMEGGMDVGPAPAPKSR